MKVRLDVPITITLKGSITIEMEVNPNASLNEVCHAATLDVQEMDAKKLVKDGKFSESDVDAGRPTSVNKV